MSAAVPVLTDWHCRRSHELAAIAALLALPGVLHAGSFTPLGDLPGGAFASRTGAVSAGGSVVVGLSLSANGQDICTGMTALVTLRRRSRRPGHITPGAATCS